MAKYGIVEHRDQVEFLDQIDGRCSLGHARVVASNAYFNGEETLYYALIEEIELFDHDAKVLSELESINSNTN